MNSNVFHIEGVVSGVSTKTQKPYFMLHYTRDFVQGGSQVKVGKECSSQYIEGNCPSDIVPGCEVEFIFEIGGFGKPQVVGVKLISNADKQHK